MKKIPPPQPLRYERLDPTDERWQSLPVTDVAQAVEEVNRHRHALARIKYNRLYGRIRNQIYNEIKSLNKEKLKAL